jgi:hypothetical protein
LQKAATEKPRSCDSLGRGKSSRYLVVMGAA